jgi:hypothetical protein
MELTNKSRHIPTTAAQENIVDNPELVEMFKNDQADRTNHIDWNIVQKNDSLREARVYELLDSNKVRTSTDYNNAALIFHHGEDSIAYRMAVELMKKSIELDSTRDKWFLATEHTAGPLGYAPYITNIHYSQV